MLIALGACTLQDHAQSHGKYPPGGVYIVKTGDTPFLISKKLNVNMEALIAANDLLPPYEVHKGQQLRLPVAGGKVAEPIDSPTVEAVPTPVVAQENMNSNAVKTPQPPEKPLPVKKQIKELRPQKFIWPLKGKVVAKYGPLSGGMFNNGINIAGSEGEEVKAIADGEVIYIGTNVKGFGNLVVLRHYGGWFSAYSYSKMADIKKGDFIAQGEAIGYIGANNEHKKPQLHLVLRKKKKLVDPVHYLP